MGSASSSTTIPLLLLDDIRGGNRPAAGKPRTGLRASFHRADIQPGDGPATTCCDDITSLGQREHCSLSEVHAGRRAPDAAVHPTVPSAPTKPDQQAGAHAGHARSLVVPAADEERSPAPPPRTRWRRPR